MLLEIVIMPDVLQYAVIAVVAWLGGVWWSWRIRTTRGGLCLTCLQNGRVTRLKGN